MKARQLWLTLLGSLWFIPSAMVAGSVALAVVLIELSVHVDVATVARMPRLFGAGADGARGMLSTIAGSIITVAGVAFSLTIAALAQASSQYTPRVLRTFMGDRSSQVVLGTFVGIFAYCLVVLRTIRGGDEGAFVPPIAVLGGFLLALVGVGVLVFFIHHTASGLQASTILARVRRTTEMAIDTVFPVELAHGEDDPVPGGAGVRIANDDWRPVPALRTGYVQSVDVDGLATCALSRAMIIRVERSVGTFAIENHPLVTVARVPAGNRDPEDGDSHECLTELINDFFRIDNYRTVEQDPAFGILQIVDIALRALSPGINDTTTAVTCVDHLSALLVRLARRQVAPAAASTSLAPIGAAHAVITSDPTFADLLGLALDDVRRNAGGNVTVLGGLIDAIAITALHASAPARRRHLARHLEHLNTAIRQSVQSEEDKTSLATRIAAAHQALLLADARTPHGVDNQRSRNSSALTGVAPTGTKRSGEIT
ncbi:MAG: DUF2254 domain-containing protein [Gemmatimonadaceae bacterium]